MDALRVLCASCHEFLYWFKGDFKGDFQMLDFVPSRRDVPAPKPRSPMLCPVCGKAWYVLRATGAICLLTDRGWKPRAPDGEAPVTMRQGIQALLPEIPKDMRDGHGDFKER